MWEKERERRRERGRKRDWAARSPIPLRERTRYLTHLLFDRYIRSILVGWVAYSVYEIMCSSTKLSLMFSMRRYFGRESNEPLTSIGERIKFYLVQLDFLLVRVPSAISPYLFQKFPCFFIDRLEKDICVFWRDVDRIKISCLSRSCFTFHTF